MRSTHTITLSRGRASPIRIPMFRATNFDLSDLIKVGGFVPRFVSPLSHLRVYSLINLICVYTIHAAVANRCHRASTHFQFTSS